MFRSFDAVEYLESDMARKYRKQLQCYQCDAQFKNKGIVLYLTMQSHSLM